MENDLGSDDFENLVSFIRTIVIKDKPKEDILKEFNNLIFSTGKLRRGKDFIDYVQSYRTIYQRVILDKEVELGSNTVAFKNLINIMTDFLQSNEWMPELLYYFKKFSTNKLYEFLVLLENKFVADWVIAYTPTKRTVNLNAILKDIEQAKTAEDVLKSDSLKYDKNALINELEKDIYGKRHAKYILLKLEYLETEQINVKNYGTISVEHVLPQNPKENSKWLENFNIENRKSLTNKLCNLILLSNKKNSQASNLDFDEKKRKYLSGRLTDLVRSQQVLSYNEWTPQVLKQRQEKIIKSFE